MYVNEREPGGGWTTGWELGPEFKAQIELDSSLEARVAASTGFVNLYTVRVPKELDFSNITYFSRAYQAVGKSDEPVVFRITSGPDEKAAPDESTLDFKVFNASKSALPAATYFPPVE